MVTEYCANKDLQSFLYDNSKNLEVADLTAMYNLPFISLIIFRVLQIAKGMFYIHKTGIIHR
jgi:hypothetical protein